MANHASHAALPYPIKGARFTILVPYLDADGDPTDPTTPDTEISEDDAAATDAAEEVASPKNSVGMLTLTGAETDCSCLSLAGKAASGPKTTLATLYPRVLAVVGSGTLSAGSAGGGTLGTLLAYDVTGCFIKTTGGTGGGGTGGANNQARKIVTYNTSSGAFTVTPNWETTPSTDTTYEVLLPEGVTLGMLRTLNPTTAGRTLDVSGGGEAGVDWANVGSPTTTVTLSGTTVKTATDVETDTQDIQTRIGTPSNLGGGATLSFNLSDIEAQTDDIGAAGAGLTSIPDSAGVTTLLSRIPAALFSGITSLAQWLGAMAGKQTSDATAQTEMRATGAGSGTYSAPTDSQEAIRDRGDAAWITATGFSTHSAADVWAAGTRTLTAATNITSTGGTTVPQTGDSFARLAAPAGASVSADIAAVKAQTAAIETDTQDLQSRVPAALTGAGNMKSDALAVNGSTSAAARLALTAAQMIPFTVTNAGHTPTTTEFEASDVTEATADHYNGRIIVWTSGSLAGQATSISDYALATGRGHFTVVAMTEAPANGDTGAIV